jgi:hypothetical protein
MPDRDRPAPIETATIRTDGMNSGCARCGAVFRCGMIAGDRQCWCTAYPHVMPVPRDESVCYCPRCLAELTAHPGG